ncbi:hypothetical protein JIN84_19790 [Luteolibacter yonseiensis]|uniref:Uncharacterized protein n=1 Tax=Luteolibacter yonseiensis TaxID=1144680 RepID=A0A934R8I7_9BACT|nr:PTPDL family protein [Luteolibacter yonseiensis]MBK1817873.1 hypothetical protein [Luteolibacter yonseiensis]
MKSKFSLAAVCCATLALPCFAETFTLKDGSTFEGKILSEEGDTYVVDAQVTKSIRDEKRVLKSDVVKISREQPDLKAFEALGKLAPTPDLMTAEEYQVKISSLEKFLKTYPVGTKTTEVKSALETLKAEFVQISAGGIKFDGKIISQDDFKQNAYDLDARIQEAKIRRLVEAGRYIPALRQFSEFDRDFRTSLAYADLQPLIVKVIQSQQAEAKQGLATLPARLKKREAALQQMAGDARTATDLAIKEEDAAIDANYKAEKEAKEKWITPSPYHKASLDEFDKFCTTELTRLAAVKTVIATDGGSAYRQVYNVVNSDANAAAVSAAMSAAKTALVPVRYLAPLDAQAKGRK